MRFARLLILPFLASSALGGLKKADMEKLLDPVQQANEVKRLKGLSNVSNLQSYRLFPCPQSNNEKPLYLLALNRIFDHGSNSYRGGYITKRLEELFLSPSEIAGKAETTPNLIPVKDSVIMVFDQNGDEVRIFGGDNYSKNDYFYDFNGDNIIERADANNHGVDGAKDTLISVFELKTLERNSKVLLRVIYNWHSDAADKQSEWGYTCFDDNKDGIAEIAFGPALGVSPQDSHQVIFRWSNETKSYSTDTESPHIRVLNEGESLKDIAKAGGLDYPVTYDQSDPFIRKPLDPHAPPPPPYEFHSLREADIETLASFFQGKRSEDDWRGSPDAPDTALPKGFWEMTPKDAALAFAEINRTDLHRAIFRLAIDDRNDIKPPESGWLLYDWGSSGCYSYSSALIAINFGVESPMMISQNSNTLGVVGNNAWADRPAHQVLIEHIDSTDARFLADTIFWLNRIRSYSPDEDISSGFQLSFSTADGRASCDFLSNERKLTFKVDGTVWAIKSISHRWDSHYSKQVCINLIGHLLTEGYPSHRKFKKTEKIDHHSLITPLAERLERNLNQDHREQLASKIAALLETHQENPLPAILVERLISIAESEGLSVLLPELERIHDSLIAQPPNPEFDPDWSIREPIETAIKKLKIANNATALERAVRSDRDNTLWELAQLQRVDPTAWAGILVDQFHSAPQLEQKKQILETLCAGAPEQAIALARNTNESDYATFLIPFATLHQQHAPERFVADIPNLMTFLANRNNDIYLRIAAMDVLSTYSNTDKFSVDLAALLLDEIDDPQKDSYSSTLSDAITALSYLPQARANIDIISDIDPSSYKVFNAAVAAIDRICLDQTEKKQRIRQLVQRRLNRADGMMDDLFLTCLAYDLRELKGQIKTLATHSPDIPDGEQANSARGSANLDAQRINQLRYHTAREIAALWSESNPETTAKMWIALVCAHPSDFSIERNALPLNHTLRMRAVAAINNLSPDERSNALTNISEVLPIPEYFSDVNSWLADLAKNNP